MKKMTLKIRKITRLKLKSLSRRSAAENQKAFMSNKPGKKNNVRWKLS